MNLRRMPLFLALAVVLVLAALGWLVLLSRDSQAAPAPSGDTAFKGKVLLVNTNHFMMGTFLLDKAQVQKIGDHSFLIGKGTADGRIGDWYKGRIVRVQMEHIISITEFDDLKDAKRALESTGVAGTGIVGVAVPAVPPAIVTPLPAAPAVPPPPPAVAPPGRQ